jgi:cell division protein FtsB
MPSSFSVSPSHLGRWIAAALVIFLLLWIAFFDSHSLIRRYRWHAEYERLQQENQRLQRETERLRQELAEPLTDERIEEIAREEYGMIRPGETVYRVEAK